MYPSYCVGGHVRMIGQLGQRHMDTLDVEWQSLGVFGGYKQLG